MKRVYDSIDIAKFCMSLLVAAIHLNPLGSAVDIRFPMVRIAIPVFFMISSFLFYSRLEDNGPRALCRFLKRNGRLYLAWLLLLFPITACIRGYFSGGIGDFFIKLPLNLLLGSTFRASWYISALCIGMVIVFYLSRKLGDWSAVLLGALLYAVCCLSSNYANLFADTRWFSWYPAKWYNSFPVSILWIAIGKMIAEKQHCIAGRVWSRKFPALCVSFGLLFWEHGWICQNGASYANDCYFSLVLVCPLLFITMLDFRKPVLWAKKLRPVSTVIYCLHATLAVSLAWVLRRYGVEPDVLPAAIGLYLTVVGLCAATALIIEKLKNYRWLSWLRYFV